MEGAQDTQGFQASQFCEKDQSWKFILSFYFSLSSTLGIFSSKNVDVSIIGVVMLSCMEINKYLAFYP